MFGSKFKHQRDHSDHEHSNCNHRRQSDRLLAAVHFLSQMSDGSPCVGVLLDVESVLFCDK